MYPHLKLATLSEEGTKKIQELEKQTGFQIMAFEGEVVLAMPTPDQLEKIRKLEEELNVTLLAYQF